MLQTVKSSTVNPGRIKSRSGFQTPLAYSPEAIRVRGKEYVFNYPLTCILEKEKNYYVITHALLDLIGTGLTPEYAEVNFNEEFDYLYSRLNSLEDSRLGKRLSCVKSELSQLVKEIR